MKKLTIDCSLARSEAEFWVVYLRDAEPEGAGNFGKNLDAFWDALTGGGPGYPGPVELELINTNLLDGVFCQKLKQLADELQSLRYVNVKLTLPLDEDSELAKVRRKVEVPRIPMEIPAEFLRLLPDSVVSLDEWRADGITLSVVKDAAPEVWRVHFNGVEFASLAPAFESDRWEVSPVSGLPSRYCPETFSRSAWAFVLHNVESYPILIVAESAHFARVG